jgi:hypothetical protein
MLYREIIAVCSESHTKHVNTLCGQNVEFVNVKPGGTYSSHWALEGYYICLMWRVRNVGWHFCTRTTPVTDSLPFSPDAFITLRAVFVTCYVSEGQFVSAYTCDGWRLLK